MSSPFDSFVRALARVELGPCATNQYAAGGDPHNLLRRRNLLLYLEQMAARGPGAILVGEAPSHRGARLTGIPFLSERLLLDGIPEAEMFGTGRGFRRSTEWERPSTEASATIVWETIRHLRPLPLLWNAFPFHPHLPGNPRSNRVPTVAELETGSRFLHRLIEMFDIRDVVAVGNQAARTLEGLGLEHVKVRHPSQGGKPLFVEGIERRFAKRGRRGSK